MYRNPQRAVVVNDAVKYDRMVAFAAALPEIAYNGIGLQELSEPLGQRWRNHARGHFGAWPPPKYSG